MSEKRFVDPSHLRNINDILSEYFILSRRHSRTSCVRGLQAVCMPAYRVVCENLRFPVDSSQAGSNNFIISFQLEN